MICFIYQMYGDSFNSCKRKLNSKFCGFCRYPLIGSAPHPETCIWRAGSKASTANIHLFQTFTLLHKNVRLSIRISSRNPRFPGMENKTEVFIFIICFYQCRNIIDNGLLHFTCMPWTSSGECY